MNSTFDINQINTWSKIMTDEMILVTSQMKSLCDNPKYIKLLSKELVEIQKVTILLQKLRDIKERFEDTETESTKPKKESFRTRS
jgi:hypothetical protein